MKNLLISLPFLLMTVLLSSCSDDETCDILDKNDKPSQCADADITVCTGDETYFIFNGTRYDNIGGDGGLVEACDPNASAQAALEIQLKLDAVAQRLFNEARSAAVCQ